MSPASTNRKAIVITYFLDIESTFGIPIVVLVFCDQKIEVNIRREWSPVLKYDKDADLEFLQTFIIEHFPPSGQNMSWQKALLGAENSLRAEELSGEDPHFSEKVADAMCGF